MAPAQRHRPGRRRFQLDPAATASSASRSRAAIPAPCSMATTRSAASSTSSPRAAFDLPPSARIRPAVGSSTTSTAMCPRTPPCEPRRAVARPDANAHRSDGYRENNDFARRTRSAISAGPSGRFQRLFQCLRRRLSISGCRRAARDADLEPARDRTAGAATRSTSPTRNGINAHAGVNHMLWAGHRADRGRWRASARTRPASRPVGSLRLGFKANLTALSATPRLISQHMVGGVPGKLITGVDIYQSIYDSDRSRHLGDPPIHR